MSNTIDVSQWTLFDKIMYGGLGYGAFCLPTDFFKVIVAIIFPPLGEIINIVEDTVSDSFPYITWDSMKNLLTANSLTIIVYSFLLTTLFYIPGLIYTLTNIVNKERKINYGDGTTNYSSLDTSYNSLNEIGTAGSSSGGAVSGAGSKSIGALGSAGSSAGGAISGTGSSVINSIGL